MYQLFCDSNCELWHTTVEELGLNVISMPYTVDNKEYFYDMGKNTDFKAFFDKMRGGAVPKTSALNEYAYIEYFEPVLARGEDIYYVTFSHKMSATFNAMDAAIAKLMEKYPQRRIVTKDTKTISLGSGFIVYYAALKWRSGASIEELDAYLDELIPHTATYFAVDDLTYLYRGGRISSATKVVGGLLGIKPILYFDDEGKIVSIAKAKGFRNAISKLLDYVEQKGSELDKYKTFILHADCKNLAEDIAEKVRTRFGSEAVVQPVGPVIGAHCGPGTLGLIFHSSVR